MPNWNQRVNALVPNIPRLLRGIIRNIVWMPVQFRARPGLALWTPIGNLINIGIFGR